MIIYVYVCVMYVNLRPKLVNLSLKFLKATSAKFIPNIICKCLKKISDKFTTYIIWKPSKKIVVNLPLVYWNHSKEIRGKFTTRILRKPSDTLVVNLPLYSKYLPFIYNVWFDEKDFWIKILLLVRLLIKSNFKC